MSATAADPRIAEALLALGGEMRAMRAELRGDIGRLDGKTDTLRTELRGDIQALRGEMQAARSETHTDIGRLDGKIDAVRTQAHGDLWRLIRAGAAAVVLTLGGLAWMLVHLK